MNCDHTQAVLSGEAPFINVDEHVDACEHCQQFSSELDDIDLLAQQLSPILPPPSLIADTAAQMNAEMNAETVQDKPPTVRWLAPILAIAAAALLFVQPTPTTPTTTDMQHKGLGSSTTDVDLKVSVNHEGEFSRLNRQRAYPLGDTLYFRARVDQAAQLQLVRIDEHGAIVVHQQPLSGEADLSVGADLFAWQLEDGEDDAIFALLASAEPPQNALVEQTLQDVYHRDDPEAVCRAALSIGARCSSILIQVANP